MRTSRCGTRTGKKNLFHDPTRASWACPQLAYHFLGGIMHMPPRWPPITNPTVNSYKRINAPRTSRARPGRRTRSPTAGNNRTHMVRIPDKGRFELRLPDGAANPYLLQASILAAGHVDGVATPRRIRASASTSTCTQMAYREERAEAAAQPARRAAQLREGHLR
jgi:glutamine synthetase